MPRLWSTEASVECKHCPKANQITTSSPKTTLATATRQVPLSTRHFYRRWKTPVQWNGWTKRAAPTTLSVAVPTCFVSCKRTSRRQGICLPKHTTWNSRMSWSSNRSTTPPRSSSNLKINSTTKKCKLRATTTANKQACPKLICITRTLQKRAADASTLWYHRSTKRDISSKKTSTSRRKRPNRGCWSKCRRTLPHKTFISISRMKKRESCSTSLARCAIVTRRWSTRSRWIHLLDHSIAATRSATLS